jgi:glutamate:Na+ symporter, ESS family
VTATQVFVGLLVASALVLLGKAIRGQIALLRALYLPSSLIAGALALLLGPELLGRFVGGDGSVFGSAVDEVWVVLPGLLINVVFAALFLGKRIPSPRAIWQLAGPQVAFGQTIAWGQYVVGLSLALVVLTPVFGIDPLAGALIEIGFEGGHGTAAGLAETFEAVGFEEGADLALGLATIGLVAGVLLGTIVINWAARTGRIDLDAPNGRGVDDRTADHLSDLDTREPDPSEPKEASTVDPLSIHLGFVAIAIGLGWLAREALILMEEATWGGDEGTALLANIPLFPLAMLGGVAVQIMIDRSPRPDLVDRQIMNRISGVSLDLVIVTALATLSVSAIGGQLAPFLLLAAAGITWNVVALLVLAPRMIPEHWVERGSGDFGQSMGMTVTGLLLMRIADPTNRSGALEAFGYKQLMFEPIVGGGLFTAASLPLIARFGPGWVLVLCALLAATWAVVGLRAFGAAATGRENERE